jgi:predicted nucleic-acid-binding protein
MLGLDTDVLVRFLVRDDEVQFERARSLIQREAGVSEDVFIGLMVLLETEWVLRSRYAMSKSGIIGVMLSLLGSDGIRFEDEPAIEEAIVLWKDNAANFADCLIGARNRRLGCSSTVTFDAKVMKLPASWCRRAV